MNSVKREVFNFSQFLQTEKNITNAIQISPTARENGPGKEQCTWGSKGASGSEPGFVRNSTPQGPSLEVQRLGLWAFTARDLGSIPGRGTKTQAMQPKPNETLKTRNTTHRRTAGLRDTRRARPTPAPMKPLPEGKRPVQSCLKPPEDRGCHVNAGHHATRCRLTPTFRSRSPTMLRADIRAAGVRGVPPVESSRPVCVKGRTRDTNTHGKVCALTYLSVKSGGGSPCPLTPNTALFQSLGCCPT